MCFQSLCLHRTSPRGRWFVCFCDIPLRRLASVTSAAHRLGAGCHSCWPGANRRKRGRMRLSRNSGAHHCNVYTLFFLPFFFALVIQWTQKQQEVKWDVCRRHFFLLLLPWIIWESEPLKPDTWGTTSPPGGERATRKHMSWGSFMYQQHRNENFHVPRLRGDWTATALDPLNFSANHFPQDLSEVDEKTERREWCNALLVPSDTSRRPETSPLSQSIFSPIYYVAKQRFSFDLQPCF